VQGFSDIPAAHRPPHVYLRAALNRELPAAGPDQSRRTVIVEAQPVWGTFRVVVVAVPGRRIAPPDRADKGAWFWSVEASEQIEPPAVEQPRAG